MYHSFLIHSSADGHLGCFHPSTYAPFTDEALRYRSGSCELLQVILYLSGVAVGCDINKFQKPLFEGQLTEELLSPAVGAGWVDEHHHLPRLDLVVHECLSHAASPGRRP